MDSHRKIEQIAADWLAHRDDAGRLWTDADQAALDTWLSSSAAHQVAFIRLETVWRQGDRLKALAAGMPHGMVPAKGEWRQSPFFRHRPAAATPMSAAGNAVGFVEAPAASAGLAASPRDLSVLRFKPRRTQDRRAHRRGLHLAGVTAGTLLAVSLGLVAWWQYGATEEAMFRTALGDVETVSLADGSHATLSSDTQVRVALSRRTRSIELQRGEIYFDVAKDRRRPFVVQSGDTRITAVGTRFAVRRDGGDPDSGPEQVLRVVVTEGTVRLNAGARSTVPSSLLAAGAVATVRQGEVRVESHPPEQAEQILGWRNGEVVFDGTPLAEAVAEFNRYNARKIVIQDPSLAQMRVDGSFRTTNVDGFVRLLEHAFSVHAERNGDQIVLRSQ